MSRRRELDPEIWEDAKIRELSHLGRLLFIGLITMANDFGKLRGDTNLLRCKIFPYDEVKEADLEAQLKTMSKIGLVKRYEVQKEKFIYLPNWSKHQTLTYKGRDNLPNPPTLNKSLTNPEPTLNTSRVEKSRVELNRDEVSNEKQQFRKKREELKKQVTL